MEIIIDAPSRLSAILHANLNFKKQLVHRDLVMMAALASISHDKNESHAIKYGNLILITRHDIVFSPHSVAISWSVGEMLSVTTSGNQQSRVEFFLLLCLVLYCFLFLW